MGEIASIPHAELTSHPQHQVDAFIGNSEVSRQSSLEDIRETVQQRRLGLLITLFGHIARLPTVVPASAALSIASAETDSFPYASLEVFSGPSTQDLAKTDYSRH